MIGCIVVVTHVTFAVVVVLSSRPRHPPPASPPPITSPLPHPCPPPSPPPLPPSTPPPPSPLRPRSPTPRPTPLVPAHPSDPSRASLFIQLFCFELLLSLRWCNFFVIFTRIVGHVVCIFHIGSLCCTVR